MLRLLVGLAFAAMFLALACGSPDAERREFEFTPVPFTVLPSSSGTAYPVAIGEGGARFVANRVTVEIERSNIDEFSDWANENGFDVRVTIDALPVSGTALLSVHVPDGAAPDALKAIEKQDIISAELDYLLETQ